MRAVRWEELGAYLVFEGEYGGCVGGDEGGIDGCAAVGQVVGQEGGGIVGGGQEADPVWTAIRVSWKFSVSGGSVFTLMRSSHCLLLVLSFQSRTLQSYGYVGLPRGLPMLGCVPLTLKPVCVYESPLKMFSIKIHLYKHKYPTRRKTASHSSILTKTSC